MLEKVLLYCNALVVCAFLPLATIQAEILPSHNAPVIGIGWLWDDDPQDCYKSKSTKCNNRTCLRAVLIACENKFSSNRLKKHLSQCIFGHLKYIDNVWGYKAVMRGCNVNLTAENQFEREFGICLARNAGRIYSGYIYRLEERFCRESTSYYLRLFPGVE